jgi:hypothetical protein
VTGLRLSCKWKAFDSTQVFPDFDVVQSGLSQKFGNYLALLMPYFQCNDSLGAEIIEAFGGKASQEIKSVFATEKSHFRVVQHFWLQGISLGFGNVGEIGDDQVEDSGDFVKKITVYDLSWDLVSLGVLP